MWALFIVVPIHNAAKYIREFLNSIRRQTFQEFELVIFDDGSSDGSSWIIKEVFPKAHILYGDGYCWWSKSVNECIKYSMKNDCKYVLTLNADLVLDENYLRVITTSMGGRKNIILGSAIYDFETREKYDIGANFNWKTAKLCKNIDKISGDCFELVSANVLAGRGLLIPKRAFEIVGFFEEARLPQYGADYVFTARAKKKGFGLYCDPKAILYSHVQETGVVAFTNKPCIVNFFRYLTHIKSPANLRTRWHVGRLMVPRKYFCLFMLLDVIRVIGGYFKTILRK